MSANTDTHRKNRKLKRYKVVCPTRDCSRKATEKVSIDIPGIGTLDLRVCKICIRRFRYKSTNNVKGDSGDTAIDQEVQDRIDSFSSMTNEATIDFPRGMYRI
jgi:hypothetical protein